MDIDKVLGKTIKETVKMHELFSISRSELKTKDKNIYFKDDNGRVHFVKFTRNFSKLKEIDIDDVCDCIIGKHCCSIEVTYILHDDVYISGYKVMDEPKYKLVWLKIRKRMKLNIDV